MALVECIPNFSEGQRLEVVAEIRQAIESVPGVLLLDVTSDADHNRSVITFAAPPEAIGEAAFRGIARAAVLIDLDAHTGVHPRIGAADVVPFVPLRDISMAACVQIAHEVGQRVAAELGLPVYFYEAAALHPERRNLAYVRRDAYEVLKTTIETLPDRLPDAGRPFLGKAGAVAVGAREPLIAFNAFLDTADVRVAKAVARAVRERDGGLPYVKALGLLVNGQAQVSINVIDFRKMSLFTILERVRAVAAAYGAAITHTELIGLIPQAALLESALSYLQLPPETLNRILERKLGQFTHDYRDIPFE
ncbi:MAG: glutamate formimidoyltransferase [Anaerolineae bacterium]